MKPIFLVILLVLLIGSFSVEAQEFSFLQRRLEESVKQKEPSWKLARKEVREEFAYYQWEWESESALKKSGALVQLFNESSNKKAEEGLKALIYRISVGPTRKLTGLGDEAFVWFGTHSGYGKIKFRKSNVYVDIAAPPLALAERLAKQVADLIPK